ncbi:MAG TPA: hypothetical protein VH518_23010 [Tepidisphaeraceae bacterium]|jgi:hypothetical protein
MRTMIAIPVVIAAAAAAGLSICVALNWNPHAREMIFAALACFIASELAMIPLLLTRGASQAAVAQAGLVATMIHLFGCVVLGGSLILMKSLYLGPSLVYWLLAMYWLTLITLVVGCVRAVKTAPAGTTSRQT